LFKADSGKRAAGRAHQSTVRGLNDGFSGARNYMKQGTQQARSDIMAGRDQALGYLDQGTSEAQGYYQDALPAWQQLFQRGTAGYDAYSDALGVNGAEGNARARESFQASPGYEWQLDQGINAINRRRAAGGMLASGNADIDAIEYATGLANQDWYNRLGYLQPYMGASQNAAQGQTGVYDSLARLMQGTGVNKANVATGAATNLANLSSDQARALADLIYKTRTGVGLAGAQLAENRYAAEQQAGANQLGALMGLLNLGTSFIPKPGEQ
jgi:hypothetical protein